MIVGECMIVNECIIVGECSTSLVIPLTMISVRLSTVLKRLLCIPQHLITKLHCYCKYSVLI